MWFVPGIMILASLIGAFAMVELDHKVGNDWVSRYPYLFGVGADGSRGMLTAIASSMLTVAALTFSLTLNAVTQASAQFTPRIFRNYLRDRGNQFVLGYFLAVFAYCLIVLRTIRGGDEVTFVPSLAVIVGLLLALGGIAVLIYFIHHIASSLQINGIIAGIVRETKESMEKLFPVEMGSSAKEINEEIPDEDGRQWAEVRSSEAGYLQLIDSDVLLEIARENRLLLRLEVSTGQFVGTGSTLVSVSSIAEVTRKLPEDESLSEDITDLFSISDNRTIEQDVGFGIRQLVDIALKALSSGVNDTTTAVTCVDNLGELIGELAVRKFPSRVRAADGEVFVIAHTPDFADYVDQAFDQIRISGRANLAILMRIASAIKLAASRTKSASRLDALMRQLQLIDEVGERTLETDYEREQLNARLAEIRLGLTKYPYYTHTRQRF